MIQLYKFLVTTYYSDCNDKQMTVLYNSRSWKAFQLQSVPCYLPYIVSVYLEVYDFFEPYYYDLPFPAPPFEKSTFMCFISITILEV